MSGIADRALSNIAAPEDRILRFLEGGASTVDEIAAALGLTIPATNRAIGTLFYRRQVWRRGQIIARATIWQCAHDGRTLAVLHCNPDANLEAGDARSGTGGAA